ncbi:MAG: hypothetical protein H6707_20990 [Deltaproteobacteria bacterium]|nr:hypothetical protein [Deltaproteobacteria bacterium]
MVALFERMESHVGYRKIKSCLLVGCTLFLLSSTAQANADTAHAAGMHHIAGVKAIGLAAGGSGVETHSFWGAGLFYELVAIPHWLEVELAASALFRAHITRIPIDLLFKKPFALSHNTELFVGAGPAYDLVIHDGNTHSAFSLMASVGAYYWLTERTGIVAEIDYAYVFSGDGEHVFEGAIGLMMRFGH